MSAKTMAEVLMVHFPNAESGYPGDKYRIFCDATGCDFASKLDHYGAAMSAFVAHQAAALSAAGFGLVADAKAEALEEAAAALERVDRIAAKPVNRVTPEEEAEYMEFANSGGDKNWLRARAAALRGDS